MPLVPFTSKLIEIEVTDRVIADTVIKQKARFVTLNHAQREGSCTATIHVNVALYANDNGAYGQELSGAGFSSYAVSLNADNNSIVDAQTGELLAVRTSESNDEWQQKAEEMEANVLFQGDFFELLRDTQSVKIGEMISQYIQQANAMKKFE